MGLATVEEIIGYAMRQPAKERARIAEALITSLDPQPGADIEVAWQQEIDKRLREMDSDAVKCIPWEEVRSRLLENANAES